MLSLERVSGKWKNKEKKQLFAQAAGHACRQLLEAGNNLYTYTCDELYMASPLEKKSRELGALISEEIRTALGCFMAPTMGR